MRKVLVLLVTCSLLIFGAPALAGAPEFPDFTPMDHGPEGITIDKVGNVYVSVGIPLPPPDMGYTEIWKFNRAGDGHVLATLPGPSPAGMAVQPNGKQVYVAMQFGGVFAISMAGEVTLVPGTDAMVLPNSLAFDKRGNLYITETFSFDVGDGLDYYPFCDNPAIGFNGLFGRGGIWVVPKGGTAELLVRHDLLTGTCEDNPIPFPIGANGIAYSQGSLVVANTEKALLLDIPILKDGSLGEIVELAHIEGTGLFGKWMIDGIALDVHRNIYAAMVVGSTIVRVSPDGESMEVVATPADGLTFPASLAFGTGKGERRSVFVTNLAIQTPPGFAGPGVTKIDVGVPGMPLP